MLATCAALVAASTAWKGICVDASRNYPVTCYSDVLELFSSRGLAGSSFPYVGGRLEGGAPVDTFEYPVLTGVFAWLTAQPASGRTSYLLVSALALLPFALLVAWQLSRMVGARAMLFAAAPALVLYALHNWDLLAVAATTSALWAWWRGRSGWAAVLLGVGACLKIYPGLFLLPLALDRWARRDRRGAVRVLLLGGGTVLVVNLPFVLVDRDGWWTTYAFQRARAADSSSNSLWFWVWPHLSTGQLNRLVPVLVLLGLLIACGYGLLRARREGAFPLLQVCGAVLVAFLLVNKVSSPQYTLWVLPFFALLRLHWGWWVSYAVADLLVHVGVFRWFAALVAGTDPQLWESLLRVGVWAKSSLLVLLYVVFLRARDALGAQPTQRPDVNVSTSSAISGADSAT
ncbi:hypothetical protein BH24ACT10_BH24ACT10_00230 [soil metagenome]